MPGIPLAGRGLACRKARGLAFQPTRPRHFALQDDPWNRSAYFASTAQAKACKLPEVFHITFCKHAVIEFFSWIASILAVTFTRKQDVQKIIEDQPSRDAYSAKLLEKNQSFAEYLKGFEAFLNKYLGTPARTFLFCLMLALIYSSAVFLFNLAFSKSILDSDKLPAWQSKLLFAGILMTAIVAYGFARIRHAPSEFFENPRSKKISERHYRRIRYKFLPFHLFCATYFAGAIFFVYGSWQLFFPGAWPRSPP